MRWGSAFLEQIFFEIDFQAVKFHRVQEVSKMHFRDWKPQIINHTIVRKSSTNIIKHPSPSLEAWNKYGRVLSSQITSQSCPNVFSVDLGLNPQEDVSTILQSPKMTEDDPFRAGRLSKKFPVIPIVSLCKRPSRIAATHSSGTRNNHRLTRNVGCPLTVRCVKIVKVLPRLPLNSPDSKNPEFQSAFDSQW